MIRSRVQSMFRSILHRSRLESEMSAELQFHMESYAADLMKQGLSPDDALRRARMEFGPIEAKKEECRESLGLRLFDELRADLRYATRMLKQSPGFTAVAVISLALGIGANTAIFTFAREVLLKTMAVPHAGRLRLLHWEDVRDNGFTGHSWGNFGPGIGSPFPYPLYLDMRRNNDVLEDLAAFKNVYEVTATVDGHAEAVDGALVSGNFYQSLGARIVTGRAIEPEDDTPSASPVAVISDAYWARRFARSAEALGKTIHLNRVPVMIIGVNAPEFNGPKAGGTPAVFFPLALQQQIIANPKGSLLSNPQFSWLMIIGRLKPGVGDRAANVALTAAFVNAIHRTIPELKESEIPPFSLIAGSRGEDLRTRDFSKPVYFLLALSGLVLLIACANLANLLLARSMARRREMSLRVAMGASRLRVVRQVLTESMLLAFLGGAAGLLLGYWGRSIIPVLVDDSWHPSGVDPQTDWRVFVFAFLITLATGLLFGAAPAWRCTRADMDSALKETGRMTTGRPSAFFGQSLVVFQVSLSLLLLIGAGLFVRTLRNLRTTDIGFNPEHIVLFDLHPPRTSYPAPKRVPLYRRIEEKMAALPGVQSASLSSSALIAGSFDRSCVHPAGSPPLPKEQGSPWVISIGSDFFGTMGIPLVRGRNFTSLDDGRSSKVAIVNQRLASNFFPNADPLGRTVISCDPGSTPVEIVGVSADTKYDSLRGDAPPTLYVPYRQDDDAGTMTFELKTAASTPSIASEIRDAIRSVDKDLAVQDIRTQTQQIDATLAGERIFAALTSGFGVLALILSSIGIFGIMSYTVSRRTNEIGIRMALGARASAVLRMILRETLLLTMFGVIAGLAAAAGLTRLMASMLCGLKPNDPLTFAGAALLLVIIAIAAGFTPARRAASLDPMHALRHE